MPVWTTNLTSPGRVHSNKLRKSFSTACKYFHRSTQRHISEVSSRSGHADNASRLSQPPSFTPSGHGIALPPEPGLGNSWKGTFSLLASGFHSEGGSSWPHFCQMLFLMDFSSVLSRKCVLCWKPKFSLLFCCYFFALYGTGTHLKRTANHSFGVVCINTLCWLEIDHLNPTIWKTAESHERWFCSFLWVPLLPSESSHLTSLWTETLP